ncbi:MAG: hypothetical protein JWN03_3706 [Nocardia sp.]|uniref:hypothetical protein n=1 Tax=Nocardia sp. TaxID=1821 RepID=UPI00262166F4|nr:hypothetical protein [Nocardia sp.]MCU1643431.1 hypothetical protein [Nocardia sp.]
MEPLPLPPWMNHADVDKQREIDEQTAARMGITVERLHEIDGQIAADMRAREALSDSERIVDENPKFNKGFGPVTPENTIAPGEVRAHYESSERAPMGWDPEVFARIRAESDAEQAALTPEQRERFAKLDWDYLDGLDDSDNYAPDSLQDKMRDVPGFDKDLNPFPLTGKPEENQ